MYDFKITKTDFMINGKKELLLCGELHYFRMEKQYWEKALDALVDCGCNAVAYYVPWFVHEYEEGKFDFTGELCPENALHTWIQLTQKSCHGYSGKAFIDRTAVEFQFHSVFILHLHFPPQNTSECFGNSS